MNRLLIILLCIAASFSMITFFLYKWFSKLKIVKYLPSVLCLFVGGFYFYLAKTASNGSGFEDLANMLMAMIFLVGFASGLVTALIAELWSNYNS
ncbi:hypothetical protein Desor_0760 [Desulfosporosinus orientis DSM 765]|uniref:Uncharacterized protein n=1 Tax=Desulfosporosinus orientis (strain ATCC 19365 / DSM 765 / NCIMB 8382 / VKM B-1628 / Singapore I) TaxID=768706 RepID=G7W818_DESOD|nr:hypothetical protein [Desulfosporosinus orientis]AET66444.1 hypothetical protein Desor_0760 [Desulfosporosinus orientis DSM 765]